MRERERERMGQKVKKMFKVDKLQNHTIAGVLGKNMLKYPKFYFNFSFFPRQLK